MTTSSMSTPISARASVASRSASVKFAASRRMTKLCAIEPATVPSPSPGGERHTRSTVEHLDGEIAVEKSAVVTQASAVALVDDAPVLDEQATGGERHDHAHVLLDQQHAHRVLSGDGTQGRDERLHGRGLQPLAR